MDMIRIRLTHILLCVFALPSLVNPFDAQDRAAASPLPAPYQKWLDEDVLYIITDEERAEFAKLESDTQRDKFIEDFWQGRSPKATPNANPFKEEHYRRLAYVNQHFAANLPGWKTDRGRIYILYGPPDEREEHSAEMKPNLSPGASSSRGYRSETWLYHFIQGLGRNVFFDFFDRCQCGKFELDHDPTTKRPRPHTGKV